MRSKIKGSLYCTENAKPVKTVKICRYSNSDVSYMETLYKSKKGKYFLYFIVVDTNGVIVTAFGTTPEGISPLTVNEARLWAKEHLAVFEYDQEFGAFDATREGTTVISCAVQNYQYKFLYDLRCKTNKTISELISDAITAFYDLPTNKE